MYIIKNAFFNIFRNKGRNLLLAIILLIIIIASSVTLMIHAAAGKEIGYYESQLGAEVAMKRNDEKLGTDFSQYQEPTISQLLAFSQSSYLKSSRIQGSVVSKFVNVKAVNEGNDINGGMSEQESGGQNITGYVRPNGTLIATTNEKISDEFLNGTRNIIEGKVPMNSKEVLIGNELAKLNHLKLGDTFEVKPVSMGTFGVMDTSSLKFVISGIYEDHSNEDPTQMGIASYNRRNEVFTVLDEIIATSHGNVFTVEGSFTMKHPDDIHALNEELHKTGIPQYFELSVDTQAYDRILAPYQGMKQMTLLFTVGILAFGCVILILVSMMSLRERKYEIGVLRAMGMKKKLVIGQMLLEMMMITACCLMIGLQLTKPIAKPVAQSMLHTQIEKTANQIDPSTLSIGGNSSGVSLKTKESIDVNLSTEAMAQMILVAFLLVIISSASGVWMIAKFEPMQILSERN